MDAKLICIDGQGIDGEIPLTRFPLSIGRNPSVDVLIEDSSVSRFHCVIDQVDGALVVRDLGSRTGTMVNGLKVGVSPLMPGDDLAIGGRNFRAVYSPTNAAEPGPERLSSPGPARTPRTRAPRLRARWSPSARQTRSEGNGSPQRAKGALLMLAALSVTLGARLLTTLTALPHVARPHS